MKKLILLLIVIGTAIALCAAVMPRKVKTKELHKKNVACGYTIIEFGIGVDCNGDTVKLEKSKGFQRLASGQ
jgi:hypothetical protein